MKDLLTTIVVCSLLCCASQAGIIVQYDFEGGALPGWVEAPDGIDPNATWAGTAGTGVGGTWGATSSDGDGHPTLSAASYFYTTHGTAIDSGNWVGGHAGSFDGYVHRILLDFYADSNAGGTDAPAGLSVFFRTQSGYYWHRDLSPAGGWSNYDINVAWDGNWHNSQGRSTQVEFLTDLGNVAQVGIHVVYQVGIDNQTYTLDNFTLRDDQTLPLLPMGAMFKFH